MKTIEQVLKIIRSRPGHKRAFENDYVEFIKTHNLNKIQYTLPLIFLKFDELEQKINVRFDITKCLHRIVLQRDYWDLLTIIPNDDNGVILYGAKQYATFRCNMISTTPMIDDVVSIIWKYYRGIGFH